MTALAARIKEFMQLESAGGYLLVAAAAVALIANNSPMGPLYDAFLNTPVSIRVGALEIAKPLLLWINDGLMAIFFFLVGLEIKREVLTGELSSRDKAALPAIAAVGGMAAPAVVFAFVNWGDADAMRGWAVPAATDIAFALGALALFGARVPVALKIFLLALAIIDDLGAIVVIAVFYAGELSVAALLLAGLGLAGLVLLNRLGVRHITPYALVGLFMWVCVLKSGVHATLAGVLTAIAIPIGSGIDKEASPLHELEHGLHPWVAFGVLPLFAFANAGVSFEGLSPADLLAPIPLGVALGLFIGKQVGVFGASYLAVRLGLAERPVGVSWGQIYGAACLSGIGFTMSLFIGSLAYEQPADINAVRLGVLFGSLASAGLGMLVLNALLPRTASDEAARSAAAP
jgi:NhaA family Na+:H+ antiporter